MKIIITQPTYLPWMGYFYLLDKADAAIMLDHVQFEKRSWQCRNRIKSVDGEIMLTVPTLKAKNQPINQIQINNTEDWRKKHLKAIESAYGKSPYFKNYINFFRILYAKSWEKLSELNIEIITFIAKELEIKTKFYKSSGMKLTQTKTDLLIEICKNLSANEYLSTPGSRVYMINDEYKFQENKIKLNYMLFNHPEYQQRFKPFLPYMSVIDALFNIGPEQTIKLIRENGKEVEPDEVKINGKK